ncbi:hypothetical protein LP52_15425 [Streptomonospora alba]|uniref:Uncharacterized protein n=1 Tax=Streptomonospora alba TaxID=183763 RepID=A0A0C2J9C6_9ACTN|nr:hypothetical protein LP52_15425 [Streptomonospora alba]
MCPEVTPGPRWSHRPRRRGPCASRPARRAGRGTRGPSAPGVPRLGPDPALRRRGAGTPGGSRSSWPSLRMRS